MDAIGYVRDLKEMNLYRSKSNEDIAKELIKND